MRTGLITRKVGMTRVFDARGQHVPVSVLLLDGCQVVGQRNVAQHGYTALQLGLGRQKPQRMTKAMRGYFAKANVAPTKKLVEFRVSEDALLPPGSQMRADHFITGQKVDVTGVSRGKGFAGSMKRHNFSGLRASHGVSISHRSHGSTGQCQDPGKVFKGKKMAGHMGAKQVTMHNLEVVSVDCEAGLILVRGAIPGGDNEVVLIRDAMKRKRPEGVPYPGSIIESDDGQENVQIVSKQEPGTSDELAGSADIQSDKENDNSKGRTDEG